MLATTLTLSLISFTLTARAYNLAQKALHSVWHPPPYTIEGGPLISIVIPTFMEEKWLPRCLASLSNQTYRNHEVIMADYNSKDATRRIAESYGAKIVDVPERGIGLARNLGSEEANGKYILHTDADCLYPFDFLEQLVTYAEKHPEYALLHTAIVLYEGKPVERLAYYLASILRPLHMTCGRCTFIRKDVFWQLGGYDETKGGREGYEFKPEDVDLGYRASLSGFGIDRLSWIAVATSARRIKQFGWKKYLTAEYNGFPAPRNGVF